VDTAISELLLLEPQSSDPANMPTEEERMETIRANLTRDITVKISHNTGTGVSIVTASVTYKDGLYTYQSLDEYEIYNNSTQYTNELANLFICFYPMYNNNGAAATETITIENPDDYAIGIYLVKQTGNDSETDSAALNSYTVNVRLSEAAGSGKAACKMLATNLHYGDAAARDEMQLTYTGKMLTGSLVDALNITAGETGLARPEAETRIYDVTIEVYREKKDGGAYEAKDLLTTLEGTKVD
jgi:hypothetical protein